MVGALTPTNVARVQIHNIMWVEFVVGSGSFAPEGFSPGTPVFTSHQNPKFLINFQFDQ